MPPSTSVARPVIGLAAARIGAQLLSLAWFLVAARQLSRVEFGHVGTAMVVLAVTSALAEFGVNRSVTRHVARFGFHRATVRRALAIRCATAAVVGPLIVFGAAIVGVDAPWTVVALAVVISATSGVSDLFLTTLRALGTIRVEVVVLIGERAAFLLVGIAILVAGGGPIALLVAYLATNAASAVVVARAVAAQGAVAPADGSPAFPLLDAEGRRTAVVSAVSVIVPRIAAVSIAVGGTAYAVGGMSLIQRPVDAVLVLGATALTVVHPEVRRRAARGERASSRSLSTRAAWVMVAVGLVGAGMTWLVADPVLAAISGSDGYRDMAIPLVALLAIAAVSLARQAVEVAALSEDRAGDAAAAGVGALVGGVGAAMILVPAYGLGGAIGAQLLAELCGLSILMWCARLAAPHGPSPTSNGGTVGFTGGTS